MITEQKLRQIHLHLLAASLIAEELGEVSEDQNVKELSIDLIYQISETIFNGLFNFRDKNNWGQVDEDEVLDFIHGPVY